MTKRTIVILTYPHKMTPQQSKDYIDHWFRMGMIAGMLTGIFLYTCSIILAFQVA